MVGNSKEALRFAKVLDKYLNHISKEEDRRRNCVSPLKGEQK